MEFETIFLVALQSSFFIGLIHGINPCGHSWLMLAPFVYGEKKGSRVFSLTSAFVMGTSIACLLIGFTLGSISLAIPASFEYVVDIVTVCVLIGLGAILIVKPELLHSHDHEHGPDEHSHEHEHSHAHDHDCQCGNDCEAKSAIRSVTFWSLFSIGFFNMLVPCPTVAIMYSYALDSGSVFKGTAVFASYAIGTGIALSAVIYAIYKAAGFIRTLEQGWVEPLVMRTAGVMTIAFGIYSYTTM
ncbi:sulfite exporter TauE/SafE family protein [Desulfovibrio gilichinskyi]|uniref:Nickel/cobalt exporter n=1 Tax=Desulfovibrio gilichinskyi TaxID=1519643 RepID=A0A1X7EKS5_9BACT|nr:sulfite exporter TauE/SafE family protein [Desulfovibrio gilichinskyi]SMF35473.1 nickel/cobalt exporter [Desulfovibrio gilichinskyi]